MVIWDRATYVLLIVRLAMAITEVFPRAAVIADSVRVLEDA